MRYSINKSALSCLTYSELMNYQTHANGPYPVDEESLCKLDHLQSDQQADGDQVVIQDDERQQVVCKVSGDVTCTDTQYSLIY